MLICGNQENALNSMMIRIQNAFSLYGVYTKKYKSYIFITVSCIDILAERQVWIFVEFYAEQKYIICGVVYEHFEMLQTR